MADASLEGFRDRASLRSALAQRLRALEPELRILAEGFLAEVSTIDLLAVGGEGELVSIRFAKPDDDRATLTRALADLTWLRARRADLLKLSPGVGIDPSAEPRALVVCHGFSAESLAAVDNFPENTVALWCCRGLLTDSRQVLVMEPVAAKGDPLPPAVLSARTALAPASSPSASSASSSPSTSPTSPTSSLPSTGPTAPPAQALRPPSRRPIAPAPKPIGPALRRPLADPPSPSAFRSGLVDADLEPGPAPGVDPLDPDRPPPRRFPGA